uniref:PH domain-containing protein n=1 Tax=Periophthalmus magnuspinnatus TaxID=409849 RepID=A0A3B3ZFA1_9GOBI
HPVEMSPTKAKRWKDTCGKETPPGFQGKSGWVKKAHGRVLSSYKERYISVGRTEIMVYENEDQKNCLERVDLENYDKCHEMKSGFKRKHRLVLLRSPKATNKVHDMKFQAPSAEEKEAWIKALCDGINRAKNKIFDEVRNVFKWFYNMSIDVELYGANSRVKSVCLCLCSYNQTPVDHYVIICTF